MNYAETYTEPPPLQNISGTGNHTAPNNVMRRPVDLNITRTKSMEELNSSAQNESTPTPMLITKIIEGVKNGSEVLDKGDSSTVTLPMCESSSDLGKLSFDLVSRLLASLV